VSRTENRHRIRPSRSGDRGGLLQHHWDLTQLRGRLIIARTYPGTIFLQMDRRREKLLIQVVLDEGAITLEIVRPREAIPAARTTTAARSLKPPQSGKRPGGLEAG
jgi:hypothetical protein